MRILIRGLREAYGFVATVLLASQGLPRGQYRVVRVRVKDEPHGAVSQVTMDPTFVRSGGIMAAIVARQEPQLIQDVDWTGDPFFRETLRGYTSVMAVPVVGDRLPMTWVILLKQQPEQFTESDLEESCERVALISALLANQTLADELAQANEQIDRDAKHVGELQRALLPATVPGIAGLEIATSYAPSGPAGGDLYDFFPLKEGDDNLTHPDAAPTRWCVLIGDAAGNGLAAAVVMAMVQAVLQAHPAPVAGPASLLMHANRQLCSKRIGGFFTVFLGVYEPATRRLTYANAGHPSPLLRRLSDGSICRLHDVGGYPLGIDDSVTFKEATVQLEPGDTLLLYTDGITEARNAEGDLFEQDRLTRVFRGGGDGPLELIDRLRTAVRAHQRAEVAEDDQTLVTARVL